MGTVASHARPGRDWALEEVRDVGRKGGPRAEKGRGQPALHPQVMRVGSLTLGLTVSGGVSQGNLGGLSLSLQPAWP